MLISDKSTIGIIIFPPFISRSRRVVACSEEEMAADVSENVEIKIICKWFLTVYILF
jgi:hypothetical protein